MPLQVPPWVFSYKGYKRELEFVETLPMTTTGKIRGMDLRLQEEEKKGAR